METFITELSPLFNWLLVSSMQISALVCLILAIKAIVRGRLAVRWHYWLWLLLLARMVVPWAPESRFSMFSFMPRAETVLTTKQIAKVAPASPPVVVKPKVAQETTTQKSTMPQSKEFVESIRTIPQPATTPTSTWRLRFELIDILPLVWFIVASGLAILALKCNFRLWRIIKSQRPLTESKILDLLEDCKTEMGTQTILGLIVSDRVKSPALFGVVRPSLLLPERMIETLSRQELRYVFLHELAHLKRHDIFLGWLMVILQVLHWFNPLVWFAFYRMRIDRELACDGLVLSTTGANESPEYGRTIVNIFKSFSQIQYVPGIAGILENKSQLKRRITMIAQFKKGSYQWSVLAIVLLAVLGFVALTDGRTVKGDSSAIADLFPDSLYKNLILYYSFDKDGGTKAVDISGMDFHGKIHGAKWIEEGVSGGEMSFNGKDDYIGIGEINLKAFTFSAWVKVTDSEDSGRRYGATESELRSTLDSVPMSSLRGGVHINNRRIFLLSGGGEICYALQGNVGGSIGVYVADDVEVNEYDWQFSSGVWTHVTVTHDGHTFKIYRNGKLTETGEIETDGVSGTLYIGGTNERRGDFWCGSIDEVAVFNRALSDEEVKQVFELTGSIDKMAMMPELTSLKRFAGEWTGLAVDKPEYGTSRDPLTLRLHINREGQLSGEAVGSFVRGGFNELKDLKVSGNRISFTVRHRFVGMLMAITLELKGDQLLGEGLPIDREDDHCYITLRRVSREGSIKYTTTPGKRGYILYYSFDRDEGQIVTDRSGKGNHGRVDGARYESNGKIGGAMSFDGSGDYISVTDVHLEEFSFSAWIKTPLTRGSANNRRIFTVGDGIHYYALQGNVGGGLSIVADGEEINEYDWQFEANKWTHVTLTHGRGTFKLYKDGLLTETGQMASSPVGGSLYIGGTGRHRGSFWQGMIDEVTIFNRVLNETEVKQLYANQHYKIYGRPRKVSVQPLVRPRPELTMGLERFAGVWSGMAIDKPEYGTSRDPLSLKLRIDETGRLVGEAFERFVYNDNCKVENLRVSGNQLYFEVRHRYKRMRMGITLDLEGDKLVGEGIPIDIDDDRCDITLERESSGKTISWRSGQMVKAEQ